MSKNKIGELLIQRKLISLEQFEQAIEKQQSGPSQPIGQILCQMGFLKRADLGYVLDHNKKRRKLGEILISQNLLDEGGWRMHSRSARKKISSSARR